MDDGIFTVTDAAVEKAKGSRDPEVVAAANNIFIGEPLTGSIIGMAMRFSYLGTVAVNRKLDMVWRLFALWHELAHVFRGHVDAPSFNYHRDVGIFSQPVDSRTIPRQEREANLISAEYNISTDDVLELIGYENRTMQDYRALKHRQEEIAQAYDNLRFSINYEDPSARMKYRLAEYRRALHALDEKRQDLESEMVAMNCVKTISEIAGELGTSEIILKYKLEAMRLRGYDIDVAELERYDQVFKDVR